MGGTKGAERSNTDRARAGVLKSRIIRLRADEDEYTRIAERARQAGLTLSAFVRAAAMDHPVRSMLDLEAVGELVKVAGNLGRVGGLLKLCLQEVHDKARQEEIATLLGEIRSLQREIHVIAGRVVSRK